MSDLQHAAESLRVAIDAIGGTEPPDELDDLIAVWDLLEQAHRELGVIVRDYAVQIGDKLDGAEYDHPAIGRVHSEQTRQERWNGYSLLAGLSDVTVDPATGEKEWTVPVRVLRDVVPACSSDDLTSSKWRVSGLRAAGIDPDVYRQVVYGPALVKRGPKR